MSEDTLRLYESMAAVNAGLPPELREQYADLLDTLTRWWTVATPNGHLRRRQAFTRWARDNGLRPPTRHRTLTPRPLPAGPAVPLAEVIAGYDILRRRVTACTNPRHDHFLPDGRRMTCPDCGQPARYDYAVEFYIHDSRAQACNLTAGTPQGSPCNTEPPEATR